MEGPSVYIGIIIAFVVLILASAIRILREYERAVIFRLGRLVGSKGPGIFAIIPFCYVVGDTLSPSSQVQSSPHATVLRICS